MKKDHGTNSGIINPRIFLAFIIFSVGLLLAMFGFAGTTTTSTPPTFGHPIISGIGGVGFEQGLRVDPSNPNRLYTSAPGSLSSDTSWIWHSLDGGKTFKWVVGATALEGKVTTCHGGGDSETGVDSAGHLYFADLTLANFSTSRSDDGGVSFTCSNTGVPDAVVDRQWYTFDGDPTNGGSIYLSNDEFAQAPASCGSVTNFGQNILVMYRSPVAGAGATAGIQFGPANKVSNPLGCDEGIMGNNEVSPVATTLGQPNGSGGFATLPTAVKHIFVVHDDALLHKILVGRCFPVAFGPTVPNVSDPSGLNCVDLPVANLGSKNKTGANFPTLAIDKKGNLYAVWEQAPINASGQVIGDTVLMYTFSTDQGNTWAAPIQINTSGSPVGTLHNNVFAWPVAGGDGRVDIAWYGTPGVAPKPSNGPDSCANCDWSLWLVQTLNGHAATPTFTAPILASEHFIHRGTMNTLIGGQNGDRTLGDFLQLRMGANGEAEVGYADSNNVDEVFAPHGMFVRQNGGTGLLASSSPVNISGLTPFNTVSDPSGDGKYEVNGITSASMPQLDILNSSITKITTAPCSVGAPCYQVVMQLKNLSLAPTLTQDPDPDLVWLTQWLVPSTTDPNGGKNFFVYAESTNGGALQCFVGENAASTVGGGVTLTYPGATALPAANCLSTLGANGTITIDVPLSLVNEAGAIDQKLYAVTASTMTLQEPANTVPVVAGIGGSLFNLIDVAQGYTFDASLVVVTVTASPTQINEGQTGTYTVSASSAPSQPLTVFYKMSGTAGMKATGGDYALSGTKGQVTIPAGQSSATVTLTSFQDPDEATEPKKGETAIMTLQGGTNYAPGTPNSATITILP
jgi:hypothetical protein